MSFVRNKSLYKMKHNLVKYWVSLINYRHFMVNSLVNGANKQMLKSTIYLLEFYDISTFVVCTL